VVHQYRSDRWLLIEDNLSTDNRSIDNRSIDNRSIHTSKQTRRALTAWPDIQVQLLPKAAPSKGRALAEPHPALVETTPEPGIEGLPVCIYGGTGAGATEQALRSRRYAGLLPIGMLTRVPIAGRNARNSRSSLINRQVVLDQPAIGGRAPQ
jgi:hypothetical protein